MPAHGLFKFVVQQKKKNKFTYSINFAFVKKKILIQRKPKNKKKHKKLLRVQNLNCITS